MTKGTKNGLIFTGLLLGAVLALTYRKASLLSYSFDNMEITPYWADNLKLGLTSSSFSLDVMLRNKSDEPFEVSGGGVAYLKRIEIIYKNQTVGFANVNMDAIAIPAYGNQIIKNIPVQVSNSVIIENLSNPTNLMANINLIGYVDVFGTEFQIGA